MLIFVDFFQRLHDLIKYVEICFSSAPSNRFCQVCDGSSGYSGITLAVYEGETKIRCSLRCRSLPECQLASYSEATETCKLLTNVTQECREATTDIQLMEENDINIPSTTESSINVTASKETLKSTSMSNGVNVLSVTQKIPAILTSPSSQASSEVPMTTAIATLPQSQVSTSTAAPSLPAPVSPSSTKVDATA